MGRTSRSGLTGHMYTSRRRRFGLPRWLLLTVVAGAVVALAFVNFFAH